MADTTNTAVPTTAFVDVPVAAGQPSLKLLTPATENPIQNFTLIKAPTLDQTKATTALNAFATIRQAIADVATVNSSPFVSLPNNLNNFAFDDLTQQNITGIVPGDTFTGKTAGITAEFSDLTPDNMVLTALSPNTYLGTDSGNDFLIANSGRNIMSAGSGINTFIGGAGQDTMLIDAKSKDAVGVAANFKSGDDLVAMNVDFTKTTLTIRDSAAGLEFDFAPSAGGTSPSAEFVLQGYTKADLSAGKLSVGASVSSSDPTNNFMFVHAN